MKFYYILFIFSILGCSKDNKISTDFNFIDQEAISHQNNFYPIWILGLHIWEDDKNNSSSVNYIIDEYEKNKIPFSSIIFDSPWSFSYNNFEIDTLRYPHFNQLINKLNARGTKKIFWLTGFQNIKSTDAFFTKSNYFEIFENNNLFVNNAAIYNWWKGSGAYVDFTNQMAVNKFFTLMNKVEADGFKLDEGYTYLDDKIATSIGVITKENLGHYYYRELTKLLANSKKVTLGRSYSSQGKPYLHSMPNEVTFSWSGDHRGDFQGLQEQLHDVYKSISSNHNLICWEVGGYNFPAPSKNDLLNSLKIGILLPTLNNGGRNGGLTNHLPWYHDKETIFYFKKYIDIHYNLIPYFYNELIKNGKEKLLKLDNFSKNSYFIGENLQVFTPTSSANEIECNFNIPQNWTNFFIPENLKLNKFNFKNSLDNIPLFIKKGTILPYYNPFINNNKLKFYIFPTDKKEYLFYLPNVQNNTIADIISIKYDVSKKTLEYRSNLIHDYELVIMSRNPISVINNNTNISINHTNNSSTLNITGKYGKFHFFKFNNY